MYETVMISFDPVVLPFTILLLLCAAYWLLMVLGVAGLEFLDFDFDVDAEASLEGDPTAAGGNLLTETLKFFHLGEIPVMVILSFFSVTMWATSYLTTYYLRDWDLAPWIPIALVGPNFLFSLLLTRVLLLPARSFFRALNHDAVKAQQDIVGQICLITTSEVTESFGQAEIAQDGPPIVINVRCKKGEFLRKGDAGLVESFCREDNSYWVVQNKREG